MLRPDKEDDTAEMSWILDAGSLMLDAGYRDYQNQEPGTQEQDSDTN